jgi:hypothetical protein
MGHIPLVGLTSLTLEVVPVVDWALRYAEFLCTLSVICPLQGPRGLKFFVREYEKV